MEIIKKDFTDGRRIIPLIIENKENDSALGIGFKNLVEKEGDLQEGVFLYVPRYVIKDLINLLKKYV